MKGAYTNAVSDRDGAFQAAGWRHNFLDEIGEMPPHCNRDCCALLKQEQEESRIE